MKISITKVENEVCSCNSCNAANFETPGTKKVDDLYFVLIGNTGCTLCKECLKALSEMTNNAVKEQ